MPATILSDNGVSSGSSGIKTTGANDGILALQTTTASGTATTAVTIGTDQSVTFAQSANLPNTFGFKNRIINGGMVIDQRNAGASVTPTDGQYSVDRWKASLTQASKFSLQQNAGAVTPPAGYINYLGATSLSAFSVGTGDVFGFQQCAEGLNVSDLGWGTANAQTVTLSFWVRSSLTGTFSGSVRNNAGNRSYVFSYTISAANTWEQKSVTIAGDTTGTWLTTNGIGIALYFCLGSGSTFATTAGSWSAGNYVNATGATSVVGTNGATFYITGVQLERGSTATSFDFRPYGTELQLAQRYFYSSYNTGTAVGTATGASTGSYLGYGFSANANTPFIQTTYPVTMRASPSVYTYSPVTGAQGKVRNNGTSTDVNGISYRGTNVSGISGPQGTGGANEYEWHLTASCEL